MPETRPRTTRQVRRLLLAALTAVLLMPLTSVQTSSAAPAPTSVDAPPTSQEAAAATTKRWPMRATPGRMGPLRAGMTVRQARRTGLFTDPDPTCGRALALKARPAKRIGADVFPMGGPDYATGLEWAYTTKAKWVRAKGGVRVGTELRRLRKVFGKRLTYVGGDPLNPHNAAQWFDVKGKNGVLSFGFATEERPGRRDKIAVISVSEETGRELYWGC